MERYGAESRGLSGTNNHNSPILCRFCAEWRDLEQLFPQVIYLPVGIKSVMHIFPGGMAHHDPRGYWIHIILVAQSFKGVPSGMCGVLRWDVQSATQVFYLRIEIGPWVRRSRIILEKLPHKRMERN